MNLGKRQQHMLAGMAHVGAAMVVGDALTASLCKRRLMAAAHPNGRSLVHLTAAGYRAVADMIDAGLVDPVPRAALEQETKG